MQEIVTSSKQAILAGQHIKEEKYWLEKLSGLLEKTIFPYDYNDNRPLNKAREGAAQKTESQTFQLEGEIFSRLMKLSSGSDIRMHMILTAVLAALLEKYTGRQDIIVGVPTLKQEIDAEFVNTVLTLRITVEDHMTFKDLLLQVRQTMVEAAQFQNYPVEVLPYHLGLPFSGADDFPLFDIALLLENIHDKAYIGHLHLNMIFTFSRTGERLQGTLEYNALRYEKAAAEGILSHYRRVLEEVLADVNIKIHAVEVLTDQEKHQLLVEFNGAAVEIPGDKTLPRLFLEQVERTPHCIAVVGVACGLPRRDEVNMTYEALAGASGGLARLLKQNGVGPGTITAVCAERSIEMTVGLLGILISGGAYLPLEQESPAQSKMYRLKDSSARALLFTGEAGNDDIDAAVSTLIRLENFPLSPYTGMAPNGAPGSSDPAYIIYTSGTTGRPRGVVVEHRAAVNTLLCRKEEYRLTVRHTSLQLFSYAFDGFITSFFTPLFSGARVALPGENGVRDIQQIKAAVVRHHVTHFICVPPLYQAIIENLSPAEASSLQVVTLAGDALSPGLLELSKQKNPDLEIVNEYGITEAAVMSTIYRRQEKAGRIVIGRPIWNTQLYIVDHRSRLQPIGVPGELCICGSGLARGYLNNPELTSEKYNRSHKSYRTYILYKTGDLARWLQDPMAQGAYTIEFLGRKDHQVKIRGYRIEPGEIEHRLLELPQIKDAVVMANENECGDKSLYAYLAPRRPGDSENVELNIPGIRAALLKHLPDFMIPTHFVKLERMPLTPIGKIDRRALMAMDVSMVSGVHFTAPGTPVEKKLADLWAGLLDKKQVGTDDNFFTIGGDSIKTITLLNLVNNQFKTKLKVIDLYENETIAKLALKVELAVRETENAEDELLLKETAAKIETLKQMIIEEHRLTGIEDIYPVSDIQKGLIFYGMRNADEAQYHIQFVYQLKQRDFDPVLFKKALSLLAQKHSMLRTTFNLVDYPEPVQLVHQEAVLDVEHYDISHMAPVEQERFLKEVLRQDRARAFDIGRLPLWRMKSALLGNDNIALVSTLHHVIGDGWGSASLNTELRNTYDALKRDPGFTPGELKSSYKDFIIRQEVEKERKKAAEFWKKELEDYKRADFLVTPKTGEPPLDMSNHSRLLEEAMLVNLKETAMKINTGVKHLCFAAYNYIIGMLSYEKDFVVGLLTNNRPPIEDGEKIFGCFLNTVPARVHIPTGARWLDYLEIVDKKLLDIKRYDSVSLFEIARLVGENPRDGNPFFDTLFNFVDFHIYDRLNPAPGADGGRQEMKSADPGFRVPGRQDTNTYFDFEISTTHGYFRLGCRYNRTAISDALIGKICIYFENILKEFIYRPGALMSRDSVLPEEERRRILDEFNDTSADFSREKTMHQLFEEQVIRSPGGVAVIDRDGVVQWTYEELNKKSNRLARVLRKKGLKVGGLAAVIMDRSAHMATAVMAILKAGGAYVPFEPYLPDERIRKIMESLQIDIVITNEAQLPKIGRISQTLPLLTHIICPQRSPGEGAFDEAENLSPAAAAGDIAYVIFTSGSTGVPKGVVETHRPVINVIEWVNNTFAVGYPDKLLFVASLNFDLSVYDIFGILASGGCLRVVDAEDIKNPQALLDIIMNEGITFWDSAPAALQQLAPFFHEVGGYPVQGRLRLVFLSGDWIPTPLPGAVREAFPGARVISLGGATEATIWSNYYPIGEVDPTWVSIPYGKPIRNARYYILDPQMELCPIGTPGDLYIGGQCLASEYKNDPELTAAKFIANPFIPGEKIYKTGDLARWFEDGNMEFLGRKDHQVKIRGYRIELGEIESRLLEHEEINEAVVLIKGGNRDDKYLAAYFTAVREFEQEELKTFLLKELPEYMTPRCFVQMEKMPVSANGKLDRKALPEPEASSESVGVYAPPENETQEKLVEIWSQVLGVEKESIGISADFFQLGGHSLNATMVISRIHKEFNVKVPLAEIFNSPTIRELARKIKTSESELYACVEPVEKKEYYRLSSAQRRLYFLQQMEPGNTGYNIQEGVLLEDDVNIPLLEETFRQLVRRHESLRTSFEIVNEETVQRIHDNVKFKIELFGKGDPAWSSFIRPFDLPEAPLLRVGLFKLEENRHVLLTDMHHIISDGVSHAVLKGDFGILYSGGQLPAIRLQYKDYSEWQHSEKQQQLVGRQKAYWLKELSGDIQALNIPTDYPRPIFQSYEGSTLAFDLDHEETELLNKLGREEKATLYMVLVAIYNVLLFKLSNQDEIIIGTPTAGRRHPDLERIIGMFVNTLALKNYPEAGKSFIGFLQEVKENTLKAFENQDCQFEELVELLAVKRDTSRNPIFDVVFVLQNMAVEVDGTPGAGGAGMGDSKLKLRPYRYSAGISKFDLTLTAVEGGKRIHFTFEYCTRLFKEETIQRMIEYFKRIVSAVIGIQGKKLSEIEIISAEEKNLLLYEFNDTAAEYPREKTIHGLFEEQVERTPDRIALVGHVGLVRPARPVQLTYLQLNERSGRLGQVLIEKGVNPDTIVGIMVERSLEMMVGIFGILKSGGAYLPIDPEYPQERIDYMLKDSNAKILINKSEIQNPKSETNSNDQNKNRHFGTASVLNFENLNFDIVSNFDIRASNLISSNLAYVIYTSGSTGKPKGVAVRHRNVTNFIAAMTEKIDFSPGKMMLSLTTISFDIFVLETLTPLSLGLTVVVADERHQKDGYLLKQLLQVQCIDMLQATPSRLKLLLQERDNGGALKGISELIVGGEVFPLELVDTLKKEFSGKLYNVYGPTETTVWSTLAELPR
ncbi:MAG: amino acid adenylation domain-containing protein, partial [Candidatus Aminicenantes bacterium]|nr:amino acid adenylation domain-containing protein [Candidatus Aminicenantes bacterium]